MTPYKTLLEHSLSNWHNLPLSHLVKMVEFFHFELPHCLNATTRWWQTSIDDISQTVPDISHYALVSLIIWILLANSLWRGFISPIHVSDFRQMFKCPRSYFLYRLYLSSIVTYLLIEIWRWWFHVLCFFHVLWLFYPLGIKTIKTFKFKEWLKKIVCVFE